MNPSSKPSANASGKKQQQISQKQAPPAQEQQNSGLDQSSAILTASNASSSLSSEKMQQIQDKVRELEHLLKIKDMSAQMASYFDELAKSMEGLAGGAQGKLLLTAVQITPKASTLSLTVIPYSCFRRLE